MIATRSLRLRVVASARRVRSAAPTTTDDLCSRGSFLPLARISSLPPMPTGTIGTPSFTAR